MKKTLVLFFLVTVFSLSAYSQNQKGNFFVGAEAGYVTYYKTGVFGVNASYHISNPFELSFTGLINPNVSGQDSWDDSKLGLYSLNLDCRYYILLEKKWSMGPSIGGQYILMDYKDKGYSSDNIVGLNLGWHFKINVTEAAKVNFGWHYTAADKNASHHFAYLGLGYTFGLY